METTLAETSEQIATGVKFTTVGLYIPPGLSYEKWEYLITEMTAYEQGFRWWWGDAINYGEHEYGEKFAQAIELTGLSYETFRDYCYVARNISMSVRNDRLSWTHHKLVAYLSADEQAYWLQMAGERHLSTAQLRAMLSKRGLLEDRTETKEVQDGAENDDDDDEVYDSSVQVYDPFPDDEEDDYIPGLDDDMDAYGEDDGDAIDEQYDLAYTLLDSWWVAETSSARAERRQELYDLMVEIDEGR